jgi:galactose mutarotase-like enzyme
VPARIQTFRGVPAATLSGGDYAATFLPELGMLGASLRWRGKELLSRHGGLDAWRAGHTTGMPLLAPWANRLATRRFSVGRTRVDLTGNRQVQVDGNGLPIHGLVIGAHGWSVEQFEGDDASGSLVALCELGIDRWPFPHRIEVTVVVDGDGLSVETAVVPTSRRSVPVAFGWHPYFRLPGVRRDGLVVHLPARSHLVLDERQIPTGATHREAARAVSLAGVTFDDGYRLGRDRRFSLSGDDVAIDVEFDRHYPCAQVYAPRGKSFVAIEPMTTLTNALLTGEHPFVLPGDRFAATFTVRARRA